MQKLINDLNFGKNLQRLRKENHLSQYEMVAKLQLQGRDMSRAQYAHIEQGRRNLFISDLILFKQILNVDYADFFENLIPQTDY